MLELKLESRTTIGYLKVVLLNSILESTILCPLIRKKGFPVIVSLKTVGALFDPEITTGLFSAPDTFIVASQFLKVPAAIKTVSPALAFFKAALNAPISEISELNGILHPMIVINEVDIK